MTLFLLYIFYLGLIADQLNSRKHSLFSEGEKEVSSQHGFLLLRLVKLDIKNSNTSSTILAKRTIDVNSKNSDL